MENVGQYSSTLVYPSPTSRTHDAPDNHSVNASSSWLQSHKQPSAGSPSSQSSPVYPVVDRSADHENYTSPPASASYGSIHSAEQYSSYPQSPSVRTTDDTHSVAGMGLPPQVSGNIGPDRVTRRTRTHSSLHLGIRRDRPSQPDVQTGQPDNEEVRPLSASWWWLNLAHFFLSTSHSTLPTTCPPPVPCPGRRHQRIVRNLPAISNRQTEAPCTLSRLAVAVAACPCSLLVIYLRLYLALRILRFHSFPRILVLRPLTPLIHARNRRP